jgi:hypothetical protein
MFNKINKGNDRWILKWKLQKWTFFTLMGSSRYSIIDEGILQIMIVSMQELNMWIIVMYAFVASYQTIRHVWLFFLRFFLSSDICDTFRLPPNNHLIIFAIMLGKRLIISRHVWWFGVTTLWTHGICHFFHNHGLIRKKVIR